MKERSCKPNNTWVDKGSEFYNTSLKSWLQDDDEIYSTYNKGKLAVVERLIRKLKEWNLQIYGRNIENVCIFKLFALVDDYNNTIPRTIKIKPVDISPNTYMNINVDVNTKNLD